MSYLVFHCGCGSNLFMLTHAGSVICGGCDQSQTDIACFHPSGDVDQYIDKDRIKGDPRYEGWFDEGKHPVPRLSLVKNG